LETTAGNTSGKYQDMHHLRVIQRTG